jgi:hypothetical protein
MLEVIKGRKAKPRRCLLYGTHGIGKSTWAAAAPRPIILATEDGLDDIGVDRTPLLTSTQQVGQWLIELGGPEDHGYQTLVIDSLDWLERLIWSSVCEDGSKQSIEDFGYAKGYKFALKKWDRVLQMLDAIRARGMNVVLLAHARVEKFSPPDGESYDRWQVDVHKDAAPMIQEWADEVFFATYRVNTITKEDGFKKSRTRAVGSGDRIVYTSEAATHAAKRRITLPNELALDWNEYQKHWPTGNVTPDGDIAGIVANGHSKQKENAA